MSQTGDDVGSQRKRRCDSHCRVRRNRTQRERFPGVLRSEERATALELRSGILLAGSYRPVLFSRHGGAN